MQEPTDQEKFARPVRRRSQTLLPLDAPEGVSIEQVREIHLHLPRVERGDLPPSRRKGVCGRLGNSHALARSLWGKTEIETGTGDVTVSVGS